LALNEFGLQVRKIIVIQVELALERAIRQASSALQEGNRLIQEFFKSHLQGVCASPLLRGNIR
jgi:hypothetical protein